MSNREYEILTHIHANHSVPWGDVLNTFDPQTRITETDAFLHSLLSEALIEKTYSSDRPPRCRLRLTGKGISALSTFLIRQENVHCKDAKEQEQLEQAIGNKTKHKANRNAEHRFQTHLTLWNTVLAAFLAAIFPLLIANFGAVWDFLTEFFLDILH